MFGALAANDVFVIWHCVMALKHKKESKSDSLRREKNTICGTIWENREFKKKVHFFWNENVLNEIIHQQK